MDRKKHRANTPSTSRIQGKGSKQDPTIDADRIGVAMLSLFAAERHYLEGFLDTTGVSLDGFRQAAADGSLRTGLVDYLGSSDDLLVQVAARMELKPEALAAIIARLRHSEP